MRKRLSSKLLAVILTIAICATTVLGCLMTVSADSSCYTFGNYEFSEDKSQVTLDVTITAPASLTEGFSAGYFRVKELDADSSDCLELIKVVGDGVTVEEIEDEENYFIFNVDDSYTMTLQLVFGFSTGIATDKAYKVALSDVELYHNDNSYFIQTGIGETVQVQAACKHTLAVVGTPLKTDAANGYSVYEKSVCSKCGETFNGYQLVPSVDKTDENDESASTISWSASGAYDDTLIDPADGEQTGEKNAPIIINTVEELYSLATRTPWTESLNKYYKLADGIENVVLQSPTVANEIMSYTSASEVEEYFSKNPGYQWGSVRITKNAFAGHFDGNGATFYGLYSKNNQVSGLFPITYCTDYDVNKEILTTNKLTLAKDNISVSNLNITNSYIYGTTRMGFITGEALLTDNNEYTNFQQTTGISGCYADWYLQVSNCSFYNNYMYSTDTAANSAVCNGIIAGGYNGFNKYGDVFTGGRCVSVDNCLVYGNIGIVGSTNSGIALCGQFGRSTKSSAGGPLFTNSIVLGTMPFYANGNGTVKFSAHSGTPSRYSNIYSDALTSDNMTVTYSDSTQQYSTSQIMPITNSDAIGSAAILKMTALDWGNTWVMDGVNTYPRLTKPGEKFDTIYWDGSNTKTAPTVGSGTKGDPYIISTVAELAYISGQTAKENNDLSEAFPVTNGKYYKIADGIKNIVMQPYAYVQDIMALDSAAQTKAYFEKNKASMKPWLHYGWEGSTFCGDIDFNGATVYGIYQESSNNAGLFSNIDAGAVFRNLAIKNSYMTSVSGGSNYQIGAIGAASNASGYGKGVNGIIWAQNCTVANNYMYGNATFETAAKGGNTRSGVLFGSLNGDAVYVDNCLVYGNDATLVDGSKMPLYATAGNTVKEDAVYPEDLVIKFTGTYWENGVDTGIKLHTNMIRNSVVLGCDPYDLTQDSSYRFNDINNAYENVYTDADIANDKFTNGTAASGIKGATQITAADALGAAAKSAMPNLAWGTDWYCGTSTGYPVLAPFATLGASSVSSAELALVGHNTTYNDDGSVNLNFHFVPEIAGISPALYVGTLDASKFMKLTASESSLRDQLGENALMYTIPNLSARDIDLVWLPTLVLEDSEPKEWGKSEQLALADYAKKILNGEAVYGDDVTDDIKLADKKVAAALLNYGAASDAALSVATNDYKEGETIYWTDGNRYVDQADSDLEQDENGNYLISNVSELIYVVSAGPAATYGKTFKVKDGIDNIVLQKKEIVDDIMNLSSYSEVQEYFTSNSVTNWVSITNTDDYDQYAFCGTFDGNGATIYGGSFNGTNGGLFGTLGEGAKVKNINIKNCYGNSGWYLTTLCARLVKWSYTDSEGATVSSPELPVAFDRVEIADCYLEARSGVNGNWNSAVGLLFGSHDNINTRISNLSVHGNAIYYVGGTGGAVAGYFTSLTGASLNNNSLSSFTNAMLSGCSVHDRINGGSVTVSNVYSDDTTDDTDNTKLAYVTGSMTGITAMANMPGLDWTNAWCYTNGYPALAKPAANKNIGKTIFWSGNKASALPAEIADDGAYIINTAEEMAYVILSAGVDKTVGKTFRIADDIDKIVLQPEGVLNLDEYMALSNGAEVEYYFDNKVDKTKLKEWNMAWQVFDGNFDGNGVEIYGLYCDQSDVYNSSTGAAAGYAALFPAVDGGKKYDTYDGSKPYVQRDEIGITISGITIKNAYLKSNNRLAAFVSQSYNSGGANVTGTINLNTCAVENSYIKNTNTATTHANTSGYSGVLTADCSGETIKVSEILICGNLANVAASGDGNNMCLRGGMRNDLSVLDENNVATSTMIYNTVTNSIILDLYPYGLSDAGNRKWEANCFSNVFTNMPAGTVTMKNGATVTYSPEQLAHVELKDIKGEKAKSAITCDGFWAEDGGVWYVGNDFDYPSFKPADAMPSSVQAIYDCMILDNYDVVGSGTKYLDDGSIEFGVYGTSLNLKVNPYIAFTFAFVGEYKQSKDVVVTFKSGDTVIETVTAAQMTNKEGAGRYHLYRLKNVPVTALSTGITVTASYNGGAEVDLGTYSAEGFAIMADSANKLEPCDYYANLYEAAKALLFYTDMLAARYGA